MSKRKMCRYFSEAEALAGRTYCTSPKWVKGMVPSTAAIKKICPKNTTSGCRIKTQKEHGKMCRHYGMITCHCSGNGAAKILRCPTNCNSKCEIITKKPRVVRVKAWIRVVKEDPQWNKCPLRWAATKQGGEYNTPCTILIEKKYLRRKP